MQIIDTHCHYNLEPLFGGHKSHFKLDDDSPLLKMSWQDHWQKAQTKGIIASIIIGSNLENSKKAIEIAKQDPNLYTSIGLHPEDVRADSVEQTVESLKKLISQNFSISKTKTHNSPINSHQPSAINHQIVAIGETGLDYFRLNKKSADGKRDMEKQEQLFKLQTQLANELKLPLIIHARDKTDQAYWQILKIIKKNYKIQKPFILHCVSGPIQYIKEALSIGAYIGVAANVTYKNAAPIKEIIRITPADRLLIETDAPYLPPQPYRGQICRPWMIAETAKFLQKQIGINIEQTTENAKKVFGLGIN